MNNTHQQHPQIVWECGHNKAGDDCWLTDYHGVVAAIVIGACGTPGCTCKDTIVTERVFFEGEEVAEESRQYSDKRRAYKELPRAKKRLEDCLRTILKDCGGNVDHLHCNLAEIIADQKAAETVH